MSTREEKSWSLWCDWPGCDYQFETGDGYTVFGDGWDADEIVDDSGGWRGADGTSHYCHHHPTAWASDIAEGIGGELPTDRYLLIHDGDTGDSDDDGKVSLVGADQ